MVSAWRVEINLLLEFGRIEPKLRQIETYSVIRFLMLLDRFRV